MYRTFLCTSCSLIAVAAALPAHAETAYDDTIETINVTERSLDDRNLQQLQTPGFGVGIGQAQIDAVNALNVEDSVKYAPNLIVRKRYIGDNNATLSMRGSHTTQTPRQLVSVDGFTISNFLGASFDTAPKWAVIAPSDVEHVDIIYGPMSARYSGNSMGGALLMKTREITEAGARVTAQAFSQKYDYYETDRSFEGWSIDMGLDFLPSERSTLNVSYRHFENEGQPQQWRTAARDSTYADQVTVDMGLGFPLRIAAEDSFVDATEDQIRVRGTYDLGDGWEARGLVAILIDREDTTNPRSFLIDESGAETFVGVSGTALGLRERTEMLAGLGLSGDIGGWALDLSVSRFDVLDDDRRQSDRVDPVTGIIPTTGILTDGADAAWNSLEAVAEKNLGAHTVAAGLSYAGYSFVSTTYSTADWVRANSSGIRDASGGDTRLLGAFIEDRIALSSKLEATLGLRAESWRATDGFLRAGDDRVDYTARTLEGLSPKAAVTYRPSEDWDITLSSALSKRFPTVRELYQASLIAYGANAGDLDLNGFDPDLKAEDAFDVQLQVTRRFENLDVSVNIYRQAVDNTIFSQSIPIPAADGSGTLNQQSLITNIGEVVTKGVDVIVAGEDVLTEGLAFDVNLSLLDAEVTENPLNTDLEGNAFPRVPDVRLNASLRYSPSDDWTFAAGLRYQDTPFRNIENTSNARCGTYFCVTNFTWVDLKATKRFGAFDVSLGVDNLLDDKAFVFHPYPGRTFIVEISWKGGL